jgi:N-acyl-L-homoserine lactone synthetase
MPYIAAGRLEDLPPEIRAGLGAYRYEVFVRRLGWTLPTSTDNQTSEWDQFDDGATVHIVALSPVRRICGCARLMSTTGRYLLKEVFPELLGSEPPRELTTLWELSRFAGSSQKSPDDNPSERNAPGMQLFPYALALAASFGATDVIGVVSRSVERLYRRSGLTLQRIHPDLAARSASIVACSIELSPATFSRLGCDPHELMKSVHWFGESRLPDTTGGIDDAGSSGTALLPLSDDGTPPGKTRHAGRSRLPCGSGGYTPDSSTPFEFR